MQVKQKIQVIVGNELISGNELDRLIYKNLNWRQKWKSGITQEYVSRNICDKQFFYHPFWIAKLLVIADRPPFPPKITPNMAFVDAVSGYRGLFSTIPQVKTMEAADRQLVPPRITSIEQAKDYVIDVQKKQINSMYMMKKPQHRIKETFLCYLPLWRVTLNADFLPSEYIINANTGEAETYLMSLWSKD